MWPLSFRPRPGDQQPHGCTTRASHLPDSCPFVPALPPTLLIASHTPWPPATLAGCPPGIPGVGCSPSVPNVCATVPASLVGGVQCWLPARSHVKAALESRLDVDPSGEIVVMTTFVPWKGHLHRWG